MKRQNCTRLHDKRTYIHKYSEETKHQCAQTKCSKRTNKLES